MTFTLLTAQNIHAVAAGLIPEPGQLPGALIPFCLEIMLNLNQGS
jgi:hypothetical protein